MRKRERRERERQTGHREREEREGERVRERQCRERERERERELTSEISSIVSSCEEESPPCDTQPITTNDRRVCVEEIGG